MKKYFEPVHIPMKYPAPDRKGALNDSKNHVEFLSRCRKSTQISQAIARMAAIAAMKGTYKNFLSFYKDWQQQVLLYGAAYFDREKGLLLDGATIQFGKRNGKDCIISFKYFETTLDNSTKVK